MATPEQMKAYYGHKDYPLPPPKPTPEPPHDSQQWRDYQAAKSAWQQKKSDYEQIYGPPPQPDPVESGQTDGGSGGSGGGSGAGGGGGGGGGGAGFPAARIGDLTAHGGTIVAGAPTVLIGYMPAARLTDMHTCPMVTGIVPHVGGPISSPGSATVLIGNMPAARVTDQATCTGPPDVIAKGDPTVLIG